MRPTAALRPLLLAALLAVAQASGASQPVAPSELPAEIVEGAATEELLLEADELPFEEDPLFDDYELEDPADRDPWEPFNRGVFSFNRGLDTVLFDPVTRGYQFLVPEPGRRAVERVFLNLDTPVVLANQVLQLRVGDAASTLGRFVINTTAGVAGLFDPAASVAGIRRTEADFGQTLARYGTPSGPYLVLPVFGPSTARDAVGDVVDVVSDPLSYFTGPLKWWSLLIGGSEGLVVLESNVDELRELEAGSVDFYSALRSAYLQTRDAQIRAVRGASRAPELVVAGEGS